MTTILLAMAVFGLAMAGMAISLIVKGRSFRRVCGSQVVIGPDGKPQICDTCQCGKPQQPPRPLPAAQDGPPEDD